MQFKESKNWAYHVEWLILMGSIIGCFLFVHNENVHLTNRLDGHILAINNRVDDLHKEYYELLKEIRRER